MPIYLTGYIVLALIVLIVMNIALRRSRNKKQSAPTSRQSDTRTTTEKQEVDREAEFDKTETTETEEERPQIDQKGVDALELESRQQKKRPGNRNRDKDVDDPRNFNKGPMLFAMLLGAFGAILNQTLLNVALPHIMSDFSVSASTAQWLTTAYMLTNGVLVPITAFLMQRIKTRHLFLTAMVLFGAGTLLAALAPSFVILLVARVIQAIGAGMLMPMMINIFMTIFPPEKRGAAMGTLGIVLMFAPAVGPTLSGWIIEHYSWRVLFYIVLPIIVLDIIIAFFLMRNVLKLTYPKIDVLGIILSTVGFGGILYGFSEAGNNSWTSTNVLAGLIVGGITIILFIWRELAMKDPMLDFRVFKYNMFTLTTAIRSVAVMAMFAAMLLIPIYMQDIRGYTPLQSGLLLLPGALLMGVVQPIAGRLFDKIGARPLSLFGLALTVWTTWEFQNLSDSTPYSFIMTMYAFRMVGMAAIMMPLMTAGLNQLPQRLTAHGSAMSNTMRGVASSIGTAFLVSIYTNQTKAHMTSISNSVTSSSAKQQVSGLSHQLAAATGMPQQAAQGATDEILMGMISKQALIQGLDDTFMVATGIALLAFVLSFFVKRTFPPDEQSEAEEKEEEPIANEG